MAQRLVVEITVYEEDTGDMIARREAFGFEGALENLGKLERMFQKKKNLIQETDEEKEAQLLEDEEF